SGGVAGDNGVPGGTAVLPASSWYSIRRSTMMTEPPLDSRNWRTDWPVATSTGRVAVTGPPRASVMSPGTLISTRAPATRLAVGTLKRREPEEPPPWMELASLVVLLST